MENEYPKVIKRYSKNSNVIGILLFGSVARGTQDEFSDVDIYVVLKNDGKISRSSSKSGDKHVEVLFDTIEDLKQSMKEERYAVRRNISQMLSEAKILYTTDNEVLELLLKTAKENLSHKTKFTQDEIIMHKYSVEDFWSDVQRCVRNQDMIAFGLSSSLLINNITELFLKVRGLYFKPPSQLSKTLLKTDKKFSNLMRKFYEATSLKEKERLLSRLVDYIFQLVGGALPANWSLHKKIETP